MLSDHQRLYHVGEGLLYGMLQCQSTLAKGAAPLHQG